MDYNKEALEIIQGLKLIEIKLLAIDFDDTLLNYHLESRCNAELLITKLRPFIVALIKCALLNNIEVAIVTFSFEEITIQNCLKLVFGDNNNIILKGSFGEWFKGNLFIYLF